MIGVTDIATHGQAHEFSAEVIFEARPLYLFAVVQIFRPDEANHSIDKQGSIPAGNRVGPCFAGLLIHAMVGVG